MIEDGWPLMDEHAYLVGGLVGNEWGRDGGNGSVKWGEDGLEKMGTRIRHLV